jgi:hypothetical protein
MIARGNAGFLAFSSVSWSGDKYVIVIHLYLFKKKNAIRFEERAAQVKSEHILQGRLCFKRVSVFIH